MTEDNKPAESQPVPTDEFRWNGDVYERRWVGGPSGEEWRPEPDNHP